MFQSLHFDRGFGLIAALLLVSCSSSPLDDSGTSGAAGTSGKAGTSGTAGTSGPAGTTGAGGTSMSLCTNAPPFGVCVVTDADTLPLPQYAWNQPFTRTNGPAAATIVAVGTGTAPAQCESARWFGAQGTSDWWFQARTANRLWTIGVRGLGNAPLVRENDSVTLDLEWFGTTNSGFGPPSGRLQLSDAAATPLLWSSATYGDMTGYDGAGYGPGWLKLTPGVKVCSTEEVCDDGGYDAVFTVNGAMAALPPSGAADIGGYHVANGAVIKRRSAHGACVDYFGPGYAVGAAKLP